MTLGPQRRRNARKCLAHTPFFVMPDPRLPYTKFSLMMSADWHAQGIIDSDLLEPVSTPLHH